MVDVGYHGGRLGSFEGPFTDSQLHVVEIGGIRGWQRAGHRGLLALDHRLLPAAIAAGIAVLALPAIGDGRQAGFFKRDRSTPLTRADDQWFTPLVTLLAFGAGGSLLI